jgi:thymidylate kinase
MAGRVVLIEGLDLAGKSTLVKNLRGELARRGVAVRVRRNALCPDNPIATLADQMRRDPWAAAVETGALFLAAHLWDARHFKPPLDGTVHLQDSCWVRTLAYHTFHDTPGLPTLLRKAMASFPRFNAAVFLTTGIKERQRRLAQRECEQPGNNDANDRLVMIAPDQFNVLARMLRTIKVEIAKTAIFDTVDVPQGNRTASRLIFRGPLDPDK